jgi:argininosuccinate lyase
MPQKKNPDICELIRGKVGRVYGSLFAMLSMMKNLPLAYNKDMQEDKEGLFDTIDTCNVCIDVFTKMLQTITFNKIRLLEASKRGFMAATDVADYLVKKGMPFRDAHEVSGKLVKFCIENKTTLDEIKLDKYKKFSKLFLEDIYAKIDLIKLVNDRKTIGGPSPVSVKEEIVRLKKLIQDK